MTEVWQINEIGRTFSDNNIQYEKKKFNSKLIFDFRFD